MDGHDEWALFTEKDFEEMRNHEDRSDRWDNRFVKSKRRCVWAVVFWSDDNNYHPDVRLFTSEKEAMKLCKEHRDSVLKFPFCHCSTFPEKLYVYDYSKEFVW